MEAHSHMVEMMKAASFAVIIAIGVEDNEADEEAGRLAPRTHLVATRGCQSAQVQHQ